MISKKEVRRYLKAIEIAKILFWEEGYHTRYLESIERFLKDVLKKRISQTTKWFVKYLR